MRASRAIPSVGERLGTVQLQDASADLWHAWVGRHAAQVDDLTEDVLSREERVRRASYRSSKAAERYVVTRALVRQVLASRLDIAPRDLPLGRTDTGKPIVSGGIHFSISHSGELVVLAVSDGRDVGIDIERRRHVPRVTELEQRWLTARERADVARLAPAHGASDAFLRVWTAKEARLKAIGVGISGAALELDAIAARALDELLSGCVDDAGTRYVGAIAFA